MAGCRAPLLSEQMLPMFHACLNERLCPPRELWACSLLVPTQHRKRALSDPNSILEDEGCIISALEEAEVCRKHFAKTVWHRDDDQGRGCWCMQLRNFLEVGQASCRSQRVMRLSRAHPCFAGMRGFMFVWCYHAIPG